jgi:hypothetical protein
VPAYHGDDDGDEQLSAGSILAASAVETRRRELTRDEHTSVTHTDGRFLSPGAVYVEGSGLITESDEIVELNTTTQPSQRASDHHEDAVGFLAEAFLVPEDPPIITAVPIAELSDQPSTVELSDPLPTRKWWHLSKFQCGGLILCLILVVGVSVGVAVGGSSGSPSTASSLSFEEVLEQSLPTSSQDAILVDDTPEAQAFV